MIEYDCWDWICVLAGHIEYLLETRKHPEGEPWITTLVEEDLARVKELMNKPKEKTNG